MQHTPPLLAELVLLTWDDPNTGCDPAAVLTGDNQDLLDAGIDPSINWYHLTEYYDLTSSVARNWISPGASALSTEERI